MGKWNGGMVGLKDENNFFYIDHPLFQYSIIPKC